MKADRRINYYLRSLVNEERFAFYQAIVDFSATEIGPRVLGWKRSGSSSTLGFIGSNSGWRRLSEIPRGGKLVAHRR